MPRRKHNDPMVTIRSWEESVEGKAKFWDARMAIQRKPSKAAVSIDIFTNTIVEVA